MRDEILLHGRGVRPGRSVLCVSAAKPAFQVENPMFLRPNRRRFAHRRRLVASFTPTEAGISRSASDLSIGLFISRVPPFSAPEMHFQEMVTLLAV